MSITTAGRGLASGLLGAVGTPVGVKWLAYGTGTTAFAIAQTALVAQSQREAATVTQVTTTVANDTVQLTKTFTISGTETITEIGAFNDGTTGTMFARATSTDAVFSAKAVTSGDSFALTYKCKCA